MSYDTIDSISPPITLSEDFTFYGQTISTIYVRMLLTIVIVRFCYLNIMCKTIQHMILSD